MFDFVESPFEVDDKKDSYRHIEDGLLVVEGGRIVDAGEYSALRSTLGEDVEIEDYSEHIIMPGFIDMHLHYPQTEMIGAFGEQLLEWLDTYTFPTEKKFRDKGYATKIADVFLRELFRNGTTSAMVFPTVHPESVDALFEQASRYNMRLVTGKVLMDTNAPDDLLDTAQTGYAETRGLIRKWHGKGRALYALTPRFAPTSTPAQLEACRRLKEEFPDVYVQTHLSENKSEIEWVAELFPQCTNYLDVYDRYGLVGDRSVFAHGIYLSDDEYRVLASSGSTIATCPTSNLFLGSGFFDMAKALGFGVDFAIGTDVGAGDSFSMLRTFNEAYKVAQICGYKLAEFNAFYLATLGAARSLKLDDRLGNFQPGKEADFIVMNLSATPLQELRMSRARDFRDKLFALMIMGDDRNIRATYVDGNLVHETKV